MKKYHVLALIGTLALLVNLLVPGLAFGQQPQEGTATLGCSGDGPAYSVTPGDFNFTSDGTPAGTLVSKSEDQWAFKDPAAANLQTAAGKDYIEVNDVQDPSLNGCNDGLTIEVSATDTFAGALGATIPLTGVYTASSAAACPANYTARQNICISDAAYCGTGDDTPATKAACIGGQQTAQTNTAGQAWTTRATFEALNLGQGFALTAINTPIEIMSFVDGNELFGKAGIATSYEVKIPAGTAGDTYTLPLTYTLTPL